MKKFANLLEQLLFTYSINRKIEILATYLKSLNYKEKGYAAELMGTETLEGSEVFKLKLTKKPNIVDGKEVPNVTIYYFDSENFVPIMTHQEMTQGPAKGTIMEGKMSDYQEVDGLFMPFSMSQGIKDQPGQAVIESL